MPKVKIKPVVKKSNKVILDVWCGKSWSVVKDGLSISVTSGTGFYNEKRDNANVNLIIIAEVK